MFKAIKYLAIFLYHFFFIDQATGSQSNTKFFANVGYIIWCFLFPYAVIHGITSNFELWLVFGAVVIGNRTLNVMMQNKYGSASNPGQTWSAGVMAPDVAVTTSTTATTQSTTVAPVTPVEAPAPPPPAKAGPVVPNTADLVQ